MSSIERSFRFKVKDESYTVEVPNMGQIMDIENTKVSMSEHYLELVQNGTVLSSLTADFIDMYSYFTVLCPKLITDLKAPLEKLDVFDFKELRTAYEEQLRPWLNGWIGAIREVTPVPEIKKPAGESTDQPVAPSETGTEA